MNEQLPALIVITPLFASFLVFAVSWVRQKWSFPLTVLGLGLAFASTLGVLVQVLQSGEMVYKLAGWSPPVGISFHIDTLNAFILPLVAGIAFINIIASKVHIEAEQGANTGAFYTLYLLTTSGLLGIVATSDAFNLFVLLEIASLSSYAILAMGQPRAILSSLNYLLIGTVGSSFYLLGVGYLYILTGSLNMVDIAPLLPPLFESSAVNVAFAMCLLGIFLKMAFFPLHGWLSNSYTFTSSAAASLIAPLTTKVMVYVMIRFMFSVFSPEFVFEHIHLSDIIVWIAIAAIVSGAVLALTSTNFKRILTYIIIAEIGYMVGGAWLGTRAGFTGSILHIFNDALMTFCAFLVAANLKQMLGELRLNNLQNVFAKMPWTMGALVITAMSMIGVPPTCGFFSKWYLIQGALDAGQPFFIAALVLSSLVNIILFFRIFEIGLFEPATAHSTGHHAHSPMREAPMSMLMPLLLMAVGLIVAGLYTGTLVELLIDPAIPNAIT